MFQDVRDRRRLPSSRRICLPAFLNDPAHRLWSVRPRVRFQVHPRSRLPEPAQMRHPVREMQPVKDVARRRFLLVLGGAGVVGCSGKGGGTGPSAPSCGVAGTGAGLSYCLVSKDEIVIPGMATMAICEVALMAVDDNSASIVARDEEGFYGMSAT